jgi:hypothetical protein
MSAEPRHGPVTMHRAIERAMMKSIHARPADAPRSRPAADDGEAASERADGPRAAVRAATNARGGRTGKNDRGAVTGGRRDARS